MEITRETTEQVVAGMLRENTGTHFLDSGGSYGRNWQRNQAVSDEMWEKSPDATLTFRWDFPEVSVNVYHFLTQNLDHDPDVENLFNLYSEAREEWGLEAIAGFLDFIREHDGDVAGIYGEGNEVTVNTYNHESLLSQTIQYVYASISVRLPLTAIAMLVAETETDSAARDTWKKIRAENDDGIVNLDGCYTFLQVHGGCDVRGGYTDVRVFTDSGRTELGIFDDQRATIFDTSVDGFYAQGEPTAHWTTDDGHHWYPEGTCGAGYKQLETFPLQEIDADPETVDALAEEAKEVLDRISGQYHCEEDIISHLSILADSLDKLPFHRGNVYRIALSLFEPEEHGIIAVDEDGNGRSPYTGGRLAASMH